MCPLRLRRSMPRKVVRECSYWTGYPVNSCQGVLRFFRDDPVTGVSLGSHRGGGGKGRSSAGIHRLLASLQNVVMSKIKLEPNKWLNKVTVVAFKVFYSLVKCTVFSPLSFFTRISGGQMLVTFADSKSALRVMDIDGIKVRPSHTYHNDLIPGFSKVVA